MRRTRSLMLLPTVELWWAVPRFDRPTPKAYGITLHWLLWGKTITLWRTRRQ